MPTVPPETVSAQLHWRYAVKKFDPARAVDPATWAALEDALVVSPSSYGLQPWKFFVVTSPAVKESLVPHSWNQRQVADCSHLVVFGQKVGLNPADADRLIARTSEVRGVPAEKLAGYRGMMAGALTGKPQHEIDSWSRHQVYIALGQFMTAAAMLGVDTCPMEGFVAAEYDAILGLMAQGYTAAVVCPAGHRAADDRTAGMAKVRFKAEELVEHV